VKVIITTISTSDTCTYFQNFDLTTALNAALGTAIPDIFGDINQCLCVSGIPAFVGDSTPVSLAVSLVGLAATEAALTEIVDASSGAKSCTYPDNAIPACSQSNPCAFTCSSDYILCNGACFSGSICPSSSASRRSLEEQHRLGRRLCPVGKEPCGGYKGPKSYECIDITSTLDSCGGCVFPLFGGNSTGRDCSIIPGAGSVRCHESKCAVMTCTSGWRVSEDGESCTLPKKLIYASQLS